MHAAVTTAPTGHTQPASVATAPTGHTQPASVATAPTGHTQPAAAPDSPAGPVQTAQAASLTGSAQAAATPGTQAGTAPGQALFPVNLNLTDKPVLVVGGGPVATRKVAGLVRARAQVTVVAPDAVAEIADDPDVRWQRRPYRRGEAASYRLVVAATDDPAVNAQVHHDAEAGNVFVNAADDPANCTFTLPSVVRRGDLQIAVSTNGRSPALARWLRQRLDRDLGSGYRALLDLLAEVRAETRAVLGSSEVAGWEEALDDGLLELVQAGRIGEARARLRGRLGLDTATAASTPTATAASTPTPATAHNPTDNTPATAHNPTDSTPATAHNPTDNTPATAHNPTDNTPAADRPSMARLIPRPAQALAS